MGVDRHRETADPHTMRILAAVLALCVFAPAAAAGRPVAMVAADVVVDRHAHVARASSVIVDDADQILDRRYSTTLLYRCGGSTWLTAKRIARGPASATITWRYPKRLARRKCSFRIVVVRIGQSPRARSVVLHRTL